jgi:hypothetical protein
MRRGIIYGLFIGLALIVYFLAMKLLGLEHNFYLRIFNFVILIGGVYLLLRREFFQTDKSISYFEGLGLGLRATITAVLVFLVFLAIYVKVFDPGFIEVLEESQIWGTNITLNQAAIGIFIEGMASAIAISFAWMQYFKKYTSSPTRLKSKESLGKR